MKVTKHTPKSEVKSSNELLIGLQGHSNGRGDPAWHLFLSKDVVITTTPAVTCRNSFSTAFVSTVQLALLLQQASEAIVRCSNVLGHTPRDQQACRNSQNMLTNLALWKALLRLGQCGNTRAAVPTETGCQHKCAVTHLRPDRQISTNSKLRARTSCEALQSQSKGHPAAPCRRCAVPGWPHPAVPPRRHTAPAPAPLAALPSAGPGSGLQW